MDASPTAAAPCSAERVRFINTYEPPTPFFADVLPALERRGIRASALVTSGRYRNARSSPHGVALDELPLLVRGLGKRFDAVQFGLFAPLRIARQRPDLNVFLTQPPMFHAIGSVISRRVGTPYVVHIMDLYPELLARSGVLDPGSPVYRWLSRRSLRALMGAERVLVIGRCMRDQLLSRGVAENRLTFIPNWAARNLKPIARGDNRFRAKHGLGDAFVVMYSGNMGESHILSTLLRVAERMVGMTSVRFVFVGDGSRRAEVAARIDAGQPNLDLFGYQAIDDLPHSLSAGDVHFVSLRSGFEGLVVPSKYYGILASGRPVLYEGSANGEIARAIKEDATGTVVEPGDSAALESAIRNYAMDTGLRETHARNALRSYQSRYEPNQLIQDYVAFIEDVVGDRRGVRTSPPPMIPS